MGEHELSLVGAVALIVVAGFVLITFVRALVLPLRKRIGFRVEMDTSVRGEVLSSNLGVLKQLLPESSSSWNEVKLRDLSMVLVRIENAGRAYIRKDDYQTSVRICFPKRDVVGITVTDVEGVDVALDLEGEHVPFGGWGIRVVSDDHDYCSGSILVPPVALRRGNHYRIMAVLRSVPRQAAEGPGWPPVEVEAVVAGRRARETRERTVGLSSLYVWVWRGLIVGIGLIVLAAHEVSGDGNGTEIATFAVTSVPVVGSMVVALAPTELGRMANAHLRRAHLVSQVLSWLGVIGFAAAVVLGVAGRGTEANAVYAALSGATLGSVSLVVAQQTSNARKLALLDQVNLIEDPRLRDRTRAQIALSAAGRPAEAAKLDEPAALTSPDES